MLDICNCVPNSGFPSRRFKPSLPPASENASNPGTAAASKDAGSGAAEVPAPPNDEADFPADDEDSA